MDYTKLYDVYLRHWRSIDPAIMFEILVFANMNCIYSSRDIEQACKTDIRFMWLLQGEPAPDHSTFARFQNEMLVGVIQVEEAFGVLKQDRDFRRFLTRGKTKTEAQFLLLAFVFNIKKLWNRTIDGRLGLSLFNQQAA